MRIEAKKKGFLMAPLWTTTELRCSIIFPLYTVCIGRLKFCSNWPQSRHSNSHNWLLFEYIAHMLIVLFFSAIFLKEVEYPHIPLPIVSSLKCMARQLSLVERRFVQLYSIFLKHSSCVCWNGVYFKYENLAHICIYFVCHFNEKYFTQTALVNIFS